MTGENEGFMNAASILFFLCYIPELYANYRNKNANIYNLPEKVVMLLATSLAFTYAVLEEDQALLLNYGPILGLDIIACSMRSYYVWKTHCAISWNHMKEEEQATVPQP